MIALLGNLARDIVDGKRRVGGGVYHGTRALGRLHVPARVVARCATADRDELFAPLPPSARFLDGAATASFEIALDGDGRRMSVVALGDRWTPADVPALPDSATWVHVAALVRDEFPAETLERLAHRRHVLLDGQGLVRAAEVGPLRLDAAFDADLLRSVWALKLGEEEALVLGDPRDLDVREVLLTHASRGVTIYTRRRREFIPARAVENADATGAGDVFCTTYAASRAAGLPPDTAARRAAAVVTSLLDAG